MSADPIRSLAQFLALKKATDRKFVLMLGAGASLSSGVKPTVEIAKDLVATYASPSTGDAEEVFDKLWSTSSADNRLLMLRPYLDQVPSRGYRPLADLIIQGFFDVVITFNFDRLLERALDDAGFRDYHVIVRGEVETSVIPRLVEAKEPRVKILKMHGSLRSADYFLFSKEEMLNYPEEIRSVLLKLTAHDIIICGYAFNDLCVVKAFDDGEGSGDIYFVNPKGAGPNIRGFLVRRRSQDRIISGDQGRFDDFFEALHAAVTAPPPSAVARQRQNLFKFLDHYQEEHKAWFVGRRRLTRTLVKRFETAPPPVLFLHGKPKVGKTSFVRAGLIPYLDPARFECIYVRCKRDLEPHLRAQLGVRLGQDLAGLDWATICTRLVAASPRPIVLFLDQFEKPARAWEDARDNKSAQFDFLKELLAQGGARLFVVCVGVGEMAFWKLLAMLGAKDTLEIEPLSPARVAAIITRAARKSGTTLPPTFVQDMCNGYKQTLALDHPVDKRLFTLTHVQTICYYLAKGYHQQWEGYDRLPDQGLLAALDSIRDESNIIDMVDDLPIHERRLIRSLLKLICDPEPGGNTRKIVEFIRDHFPEIKEDRFPEPLA
jgi:SIR2-like domain